MPSSQLFKRSIDKSILYNLLDNICIKTDKYYLFDQNSYKKGMYNNSISQFCEDIKPYYHKSKQTYVTRKLSYHKFVTVIRQICRYSNISFTSQIKYVNSSYDIPYFIYYSH